MGKRKSQLNSYWILGIGAVLVVLVMALWVWPTYFTDSQQVTLPGLSSVQIPSGHIDIQTAYQKRQEGAFMLDVRSLEEWEEGHIPGATLIPLDQLSQRYGELPADQEIVIYCRSGNRSGNALTFLSQAGFTGIYSMDGGINAWVSAGFEVELD
jgi:rhodanese-related sulfurtransferase